MFSNGSRQEATLSARSGRLSKVSQPRGNRVPDREPYRSLQHLVWHITAILQSIDIMEGKSECQSLEDLMGRLVQVSMLIETDLKSGPVPESEGEGKPKAGRRRQGRPEWVTTAGRLPQRAASSYREKDGGIGRK